MRSRYSAYVLKLEDYLLATWHPERGRANSTWRPTTASGWAWTVKSHVIQDDDHATVEFVARYRIAGGASPARISRFVREDGRWLLPRRRAVLIARR
jgi:SEC-C motif-containing protein